MNGILDIFNPNQVSEAVTCVLTLKAPGTVIARMNADIEDVEKTALLTNFYTPDQMNKIIQVAFVMVGAGTKAIENALGELNFEAAREILTDAHAAQGVVARDVQPFQDAIRQARSGGFQIIESSGFKRWVVRMLKAGRDDFLAVGLVTCTRPALLLALADGLTTAFLGLVEVVKAVVEVTVAVVKAAGNLVLKIPDLLGSFVSFLKFMPWIVLLAGGYYVGVKTIIPPKYDPLRLRERNTWKPWKRA